MGGEGGGGLLQGLHAGSSMQDACVSLPDSITSQPLYDRSGLGLVYMVTDTT